MDLQNLDIEILTLRHELHQLKIKGQEQENNHRKPGTKE
jgi:hypothetical protein